MASFQKSLDVDVLNVRKIYAKGENNSILAANSFLGTDGVGGTQWVDISTIKNGITFNTFVTSQSTFTSGTSSSKFSILDGDNVGLIPFGSGNSVKLYSKSFGEIDVVGQSSIYAYNALTGTIDSNVKISGTGIINISTDTTKQLINFYSPDNGLSSMSSVVGQFVGLNTILSSSITTFNSPFSTFIYSAISSFSTSLGPVISPLEVNSTISSFSTSLGPVISPLEVNSTISSFSTLLGTNIQNKLYTSSLNTSTINLSGVRQPFIQYGTSQLINGSTIVTLNPAYSTNTFSIQLTYLRGSSAPSLPLSFSTMTASNFKVIGDSAATVHWTTYGNLF